MTAADTPRDVAAEPAEPATEFQPFIIMGADDAGACVDEVCAVPDAE